MKSRILPLLYPLYVLLCERHTPVGNGNSFHQGGQRSFPLPPSCNQFRRVSTASLRGQLVTTPRTRAFVPIVAGASPEDTRELRAASCELLSRLSKPLALRLAFCLSGIGRGEKRYRDSRTVDDRFLYSMSMSISDQEIPKYFATRSLPRIN